VMVTNRPRLLVVAYWDLGALLYFLPSLLHGPLGISHGWHGAVGGVIVFGLVAWGLLRGSILAWSLALFFAVGGVASMILSGARGAQAAFFMAVCLAQGAVLVLLFSRGRQTPAV
jgi:hypothetical protein